MDPDIADTIANECVNHYLSLSKKGKPIIGQEWTLLSCVVMSANGNNTVVAMATGTKCLGRNEMSPRGDLVNDSHAEVLARRCFLRYLYDQILTFHQTGASAIISRCDEKNQYEIKPDIKFHFYSSHVPCGDASIILKHGVKRKYDDVSNKTINPKRIFLADLKKQERNHSNEECPINHIENSDTKQLNSLKSCTSKLEEKDQILLVDDDKGYSVTEDPQTVDYSRDVLVEDSDDCVGEVLDVYRTGAKCLQGEDRKLPGVSYHRVGVVRTKPGRGDPTLSVSCSDKMARWMVCGLQGSLLSLLLSRPVMLTSVVVGSGGPYSKDALERALLRRSQTSQSVALLHSSVVFPHSRYSVSLSARPCPSAILWARVSHKPLQVCVDGRRQGVTKKCRDNGCLAICKLELLRAFLSVANKSEYKEMSYKALKALADQYNTSSTQLKRALKAWTLKPPHLENFKLDSS